MTKTTKKLLTPTEQKILIPGQPDPAGATGTYDEKIARLRDLVKRHEKRSIAAQKELKQALQSVEKRVAELASMVSGACTPPTPPWVPKDQVKEHKAKVEGKVAENPANLSDLKA